LLSGLPLFGLDVVPDSREDAAARFTGEIAMEIRRMPTRFKTTLILVVAVATIAIPRLVEAVQGDGEIATETIAADPALDQLITGLALKHMPHTWERNKGWGAQQVRWDGLEWERDGWELHSRRRWKEVNHGTWRKYSASLSEPERHFRVNVSDIRRKADDMLSFTIVFSARIDLFARQAEWIKGVQLYSVSAEGSAEIDLSLDMEMRAELAPGNLPPDLLFRPKVVGANLAIAEFRIDRVSKLGGEFAQQVTQLARAEMDEEIAKKNTEIVSRINREIEDNADKLRLSLADALASRWGKQAAEILPPTITQGATTGKDN
jgi:hypothetical protein